MVSYRAAIAAKNEQMHFLMMRLFWDTLYVTCIPVYIIAEHPDQSVCNWKRKNILYCQLPTIRSGGCPIRSGGCPRMCQIWPGESDGVESGTAAGLIRINTSWIWQKLPPFPLLKNALIGQNGILLVQKPIFKACKNWTVGSWDLNFSLIGH